MGRLRHARSILLLLGLLSGCGADARLAETDGAGSPSSLLVASGEGHVVVAEVNGVPIHDDCVAAQAAGLGISPREALEQCIDFELLAQAAQARGKHRDPAVHEARKTESVRRLLDTSIADALPGADRLDRKLLDSTYARLRPRIHRPELRTVTHVLARLPDNEPPDTPADRAARALAQDIHHALADQRGLTADDFERIAQETAGDRDLGPHDATTGAFRREEFQVWAEQTSVHEDFIRAVFALDGPGSVSPPTRTHVGWHVILLTEILPAQNTTADEAAELVLAFLRGERYESLVASLQRSASVEVNEDALLRLQAAEDALRFAPSESP